MKSQVELGLVAACFAILLGNSGAAFSKVFSTSLDEEAAPGLIDTDILGEPPTKPHDGEVEQCMMKVAMTKCYAKEGFFYAERGIPAMPAQLLSTIQDGVVKDRESFRYDRERFLANVKQYRFEGDGTLLQPMPVDWAQLEYYSWVSADRDPDAREISRIWAEIEEYLSTSRLGVDGFFLLNVDHGRLRSTQVCWYFLAFSDPTAPKCQAVLVEADGTVYVKYIRAIYNGGYAYTPPLSFECSNEIDYVKALADRFNGDPFFADSVKHEKNKAMPDIASIFVTKESGNSVIFPGYRETLFISVSVYRYSSHDVLISIDPDMFLSKQNVKDLTLVTAPSAEQDAYFKEHIERSISSIDGCERVRGPVE